MDAHLSIARKRGVETVDQECRKRDGNVGDNVLLCGLCGVRISVIM